MNVSVKGEYALLAVFDLSSHPPGEPVRIADIAKRQKIPQKFLELILASLKQGGFVESRRGAEGGYLLARGPDSIKIGELLRFVEGARDEKTRTRRQTASPFSDMWARVNHAVSEILDETSFADLQRAWKDKRAKFVPNWEI
jgi:Rrf2 family transcriptional regulator, cysteine metabolism repressor